MIPSRRLVILAAVLLLPLLVLLLQLDLLTVCLRVLEGLRACCATASAHAGGLGACPAGAGV